MIDENAPAVPPHPQSCTGTDRLEELALAHGMSMEAAQAVADIDKTMARVRRSMARREFGRTVIQLLDSSLDVGHLDILSTIANEWSEIEVASREMTVGLVAELLNIDPSRASRLAADVVERGYARRVASQADARRICLELTDKGRDLSRRVRETKWSVMSKSFSRWDEAELVTFARLLEKFTSWTKDGLDPKP